MRLWGIVIWIVAYMVGIPSGLELMIHPSDSVRLLDFVFLISLVAWITSLVLVAAGS